ncbi:hypothetical protein EIN_286800 [Entamoeba invadens IP1]|uniref:small monomeric GTPase n=1 Tax=Entamoeba invadens IP1 TaxID=370355 RepID=A0A0A1UAY5_ENTIV|nr:hypothetical protein EIN_286800 [Entamoeba invadens IP1]ELP89334.1 hypothetical protein EIN_286800 [Entamoeba invadens IP1]|eukprot:XP_004256105.1 hypothetical protein EIN_286800 [Entamoeba invadens IP1]
MYKKETKKTKIVVFGFGSVGKSSITVRLVSDFFVQTYDPTIEDSYFVTMKVDGKSYVLDILDTAGSEEYSTIRDVYTRNADGFLVVYSITDRVSFDELDYFRKKIYTTQQKAYIEHIPIVLCGNKSDLESVRTVSIEEGEKLAEEWRVSFYETSAKNKININEIFIEVVNDIVRTKYKQKQVDDKYNKTCVVV